MNLRHPIDDPPPECEDVLMLVMASDLSIIPRPWWDHGARIKDDVWTFTGDGRVTGRVLAWQPLPPVPGRADWPEHLGPYPIQHEEESE